MSVYCLMSWLSLPSLEGFRKVDGATRNIIETAGRGGLRESGNTQLPLPAPGGIGDGVEVLSGSRRAGAPL